MDTYSLFALLAALFLLGGALATLRRHNRTQQQKLLSQVAEEASLQQIELIRVQHPSEHDQRAYELTENRRQQVWTSLSFQTSLAPKKIWQLSFGLIKEIAAIYHPEIENPQFQASILDLLELNERVIARILEHLDEFPLSTIKNLNIQDALTYKEYYDKYSKFELIEFAKHHKHLYEIGQYLWMGYNALNPWYWGRKAVFTASREGTTRYLLSLIITIVGEEAILVYSKRYIRKQSVSVEKNIAFEMINMAVADGIVSQEEYSVILNFVLNNSRFDDRVKITLLQALQHKKPVKTTEIPGGYSDKDKQRLLTEVERVAKADRFGILKKREALKLLEESLDVISSYRPQLELAPPKEVDSMNILQQNRRREEAILRLMVQAGSLDGTLPDSLADYVIQRASSYPLPFDDSEQGAMLYEAKYPSNLDDLTKWIRQKPEKERALSDVLDALLWYLPFTRGEEEFYTHVVAALSMKKSREHILRKRLEKLLPSHKLVEKPPFPLLRSLYRLIQHDEQITALQQTGTSYQFTTSGEKSQKKDADFWVCVTTTRLLLLAATMIEETLYHHHLGFSSKLTVRIESGTLYDTYIFQEDDQEIRIENTLFHSAHLKNALQPYIQAEHPALPADDSREK